MVIYKELNPQFTYININIYVSFPPAHTTIVTLVMRCKENIKITGT
jgi:hypothetical protein